MLNVGDKVITIDGFLGTIKSTHHIDTDLQNCRAYYGVKINAPYNEQDLRFYFQEDLSKTQAHYDASPIKFELDEDFKQFINDSMYPESTKVKNVNKDAEVCDHDWKSYHGLTQQYDYCTKCDEKKS